MVSRAQQALDSAKSLAELVNSLINETSDFDLQRLLKQIDADLMDVQHKLSIAVRLSERR